MSSEGEDDLLLITSFTANVLKEVHDQCDHQEDEEELEQEGGSLVDLDDEEARNGRDAMEELEHGISENRGVYDKTGEEEEAEDEDVTQSAISLLPQHLTGVGGMSLHDIELLSSMGVSLNARGISPDLSEAEERVEEVEQDVEVDLDLEIEDVGGKAPLVAAEEVEEGVESSSPIPSLDSPFLHSPGISLSLDIEHEHDITPPPTTRASGFAPPPAYPTFPPLLKSHSFPRPVSPSLSLPSLPSLLGPNTTPSINPDEIPPALKKRRGRPPGRKDSPLLKELSGMGVGKMRGRPIGGLNKKGTIKMREEAERARRVAEGWVEEVVVKKSRGRPKGAKNKPKAPKSSDIYTDGVSSAYRMDEQYATEQQIAHSLAEALRGATGSGADLFTRALRDEMDLGEEVDRDGDVQIDDERGEGDDIEVDIDPELRG